MGKEVYLFIFTTGLSLIVELDAVTVNTSALCPTNKIAPHRRILSLEQIQPRTFGVFYDLLANPGPQRPHRPQYPHRPQADELNDLVEQPQEDDPNDCGEIEDYDETDLSSVTPQPQRRRNSRQKFFQNDFRPPYFPVNSRPPAQPQRPPRPSTRPPFWSGGIFGSNVYRPPVHHRPTNHIKPVQEDTEDTYMPYRPEVVGGHVGHVVGYPANRPTTDSNQDSETKRPFRFPYDRQSDRNPRSGRLHSNGIIGSFADLFFK